MMINYIECKCFGWCRDWSELPEGVKPDHHPNCPAYKPLLFKKISYDKNSFIATPKEAENFLSDDENCNEYVVSDIYLTQHQFDNLKEFQGF